VPFKVLLQLLMLTLPLTDRHRLMLFDYAHLNGLWQYRLIELSLISSCTAIAYHWHVVIPKTDVFAVTHRILVTGRTKGLFLFGRHRGVKVEQYLFKQLQIILLFLKILAVWFGESS